MRDGGWAGRVTQLPRMRGEACLTDLQQGRRHHVLSGGRRWPLGVDRAATMDPSSKYGNFERYYQATKINQKHPEDYQVYENGSSSEIRPS